MPAPEIVPPVCVNEAAVPELAAIDSVPPVTASPLAIVAPVIFVVPPDTSTTPAPLKASPDSVNVPASKSSVAPLATVNVPAVDVPPPSNSSVPVCTDTAPVLVRATPIALVPVVTVCSSVPALTNAFVPAPLTTTSAPWMSKVPAEIVPDRPAAEAGSIGILADIDVSASPVYRPWFSRTRTPSRYRPYDAPDT